MKLNNVLETFVISMRNAEAVALQGGESKEAIRSTVAMLYRLTRLAEPKQSRKRSHRPRDSRDDEGTDREPAISIQESRVQKKKRQDSVSRSEGNIPPRLHLCVCVGLGLGV